MLYYYQLQKGVMISHYNVIVNVLQIHTYERSGRLPGPAHLETVLGVMPQSHIYGLVVICHAYVYAGDNIITLPRYTMPWMLAAIAKFKISTLFIVPPIIIQLANNATTLAKHDLSSVKMIWTGAAPLAQEVAEKIVSQHPTWHVLQGYGLTETCTLVSSSSPNDPWLGSSGSLLPGLKTMLMSPDNQPIKDYDTPGELLIQSPSNALGTSTRWLRRRRRSKMTDSCARVMRQFSGGVRRVTIICSSSIGSRSSSRSR
jgi:acyl-CoA synthetase (AMP-forming)/AMP-acid ligase II